MSAISLGSKNVSGSLLAGNTGFATAYEHIQSITVGSLGASSVSFTEIPQNYRHLQIRLVSRQTTAGDRRLSVNFNNNSTTSSYNYHWVYGNGTGAASEYSASVFPAVSYTTNSADTGLPSSYGAAVLDVLDYTNTVKNKVTRSLSGNDTGSTGSSIVAFISGLWMNTSAITSITFSYSSGMISQYSTFSLYGVK